MHNNVTNNRALSAQYYCLMRSITQFSLHLLLFIVGVLPEERFATFRYDCSSYFLELDVERLRSVVSSQYLLNDACSGSTHLHVVSLSHDGVSCRVVYEFVPNRKAFELNPLCAYTARNATKNAIISAFGFQWGCPQSRMPVRITSYYSVVLHVDEDETSGVSVTHQTKCIVNSLNYEANTTVDCFMNEYGGYGWSIPDPNGLCWLEEFEKISTELIEILRESVIFCSYRMFLYIGYLNSHKNDTVKIASEVVGALSRECQNSPAWMFDSTYFDFLYLMDLMLYEYCNDGSFVAHANESFPAVFELLNTFADRLTSYYDIRTQRLFHRSRMFHVHSIPRKELRSTQVTCGEQFNVTVVKAYFPLTVVCTGRLYALAENDLFEMFLTAGFLKIQPESEKSIFQQFEVVISYNLPEFHHPGEYLCGRYEDTTPLSKSSFGGCRLETVGKYTVSCRCLSPGYYALLQDRPLSGNFEGRILNFLNKPTTRVTHTAVIVVVSVSIVLYGTVLWSRRALNLYCSSQVRREKVFLELNLEIQALLLARTIVQLHAISVRWRNDCVFPGAVQQVLHHLLNVFNVLGGTVIFIANRLHRIQRIIWKISLALYVLAITAGVLLYLFHGTHYNQRNCLPDDFMGGMVYPSVALNILALVFLSFFWCVRPYRNIDEWFGMLLNVTMSLFLWVQFVVGNDDTYSFRKLVVRLTTLTLAHAVVCSVYQCLIKLSMIMWYWRLSKAVYQSVLPKCAEGKRCTSSENEQRQNATLSERSGEPATQRPSILS
ncbi:hypothetical protein CRM22_002021 [Opisthorchis felineus]|uniref:Uncharacterized protein n=1 Tax=Opisthorchis felineus TaxID=147828 RepID=A0A4V3SGI9_OPIFE|nr:hypothetical protein CRM22_002021 [Opisthorchis felineus]